MPRRKKGHTTTVVKKIFADGSIEEVEEDMTLAQMQEFVGGYIEMVRCLLPHKAMIINEDGVALDLPFNPKATAMLYPVTLVTPPGIRGNVLIVKHM